MVKYKIVRQKHYFSVYERLFGFLWFQPIVTEFGTVGFPTVAECEKWIDEQSSPSGDEESK